MATHRKNPDRESGQAPRQEKASQEVHPTVVKIALGAALVGLAGMWLTFGWTLEIGYLLAIVSVFALVFFATLLIPLSYTSDDPRWRRRRTSFARFLEQRIPIHDSRLPGREVLLQITLLPVALAFAFTAIGLVWTLLH